MDSQIPQTPNQNDVCRTPRRKRTWTPGSVTNAFSVKRRRVSSVSVDLTKEFRLQVEKPTTPSSSNADRFIATNKPDFASLTVSPRTNRIARVFGIVEDRILNYADTNAIASSSRQPDKPLMHHRLNFLQLLSKNVQASPTSASSHLLKRQQFLLALDGPGVSSDLYSYPLSWSGNGHNNIAVACRNDVYFQNLDTRDITHLCQLPMQGRLISIDWCLVDPQNIGIGSTIGSVHVWDAMVRKPVRRWVDDDLTGVGGMSWNENVVSVGFQQGPICLYDVRVKEEIGRITRHKSKVIGCRWNQDGKYLATSDRDGVVFVWDARANKVLSNGDRLGGKMKHHAPVKALAWCPWQTDLLATGSSYPDGKIRIFSIKSTSPIPQPVHVIPLHTATTSLQWSPHCKEILSTHGPSWSPNASLTTPNPLSIKTVLRNSLTVHTYPSLKRIVSVTAHGHAVGQSCLSPDGTMVFTISPVEEAMKMWKVWGVRAPVKKEKTLFDKFSIR
ncbi:WD40 repeat-like protein [Abortiporus biennis]|nr:WD40 repeat-like protein [Abortiporus biennis]